MTAPFQTTQEILEENALLKQRLRELEHRETAYQQTVEALQESEEQYRTLLSESSDPIFSFTPEGQYKYVNRAFAVGVGKSVADIIGKTIWDVFSREEADLRFAALSQVFRTGAEKIIEVRVPREGGDRFYVTTITPVKDTEGMIRTVICSSKDITDRKRMEAELERSRDFIENVEDACFELDLEGRLVFCNEPFLKTLGYTVDEVRDLSVWDRHPTREEAKRIIKIYESVYRTGIPTKIVEYQSLHKDGSIATAEVSISLIRDKSGKPVGFRSIARDITERKRAEEALREGDIRYQSIFENTGTGMLIVEEDMTISFVNAEFEKLTGYTRQEVEGKRKWTEFVDPADLERMVQQHKLRRIDKRQAINKYAFRLLHKDGFFKHVYMTVDLMPGTPKSVASLMDITEQKKEEEMRRELEERLKRSEKMESLGLLAGGVAHDLNNVLGILIGYSELLLGKIEASSPVRSYAAQIMEASQRAAAIVQDLLTMARRGVPTRQVLNLNNIVLDVQQSPQFEKLSFHHPLTRIETRLEPDLLNISGSLVHLDKMLFNLISNASEAMPKGGILTVRTANQYLDKPIQGYDEVQEGDYVVLSVSDTGGGIPEKDMRRIFEPFYTKKVMGRSGTGLGLAVVWGTVKDHHGYINVQSEEGKGSIFTLYFPVTREGIPADPAAVSRSAYQGNGESILIVDDVAGQRDLAAEMLKMLNYAVATVSSGEEAVAHVKAHKVDLLVLDMIMDRGLDGLDTYKKILEIHPQQKAIIVSGFSESERVSAAQALGAGTYLKKPYIIEHLGMAVRKELDRPG